MKKLFVLVLTVALVLSMAAVSMAEVTVTGEAQTGYKTTSPDGGTSTSTDYAFAKIAASGKLGDDCTATVAFIADPVSTDVKTDEASILFTEDFGTAKFGYYGWNNNLKDIVACARGDVKSQLTSSVSIKAADAVTIGIAYAIQPSDAQGKNEKAANAALFGIDLGYAADAFGVNFLATNTGGADKEGKPASTTGLQGYYKMDAFKVFLQYASAGLKDATIGTTSAKYGEDVVNQIIGATYEPADGPFSARFEYDLAKSDKNGEKANAMGIRFAYKLANGAKIQFQNATDKAKTGTTEIKLIAAF